MRNLDKSLANTVSTSSGWKNTFPSDKTVSTIDFWLSWNEDTSAEKNAVVGAKDTLHVILRLRIAYTNGTITSADFGEKNNSLVIRESLTSTVEVLEPEANIFEDSTAKRIHVALTHKSGEDINLYLKRSIQNSYQCR